MRVSNTAIGLIQIVFGTAVFLYARTFPRLEKDMPGPALFPIVLAVLFILTGVILVIQGIRNREKLLKFDTTGLRTSGVINILVVLAVILFYIFLADFFGFQITSFVLLFILMKWLRVSIRGSLIMAFGVTLSIYFLFAKMLMVPLPWGLLGW
jgi:putative tricarboxylic transport membrane protein